MISLLASFAGGVVSNYFFYRPSLNKVDLIGLSGLQATAIFFASLTVANGAHNKLLEPRYEQYRKIAFFGTYSLSGIIFTIAAKILMDRLSIPYDYKKAFTSFALSSILGLSADLYIDN